MALLHKTNQAHIALKAGFTLEDTGIVKLESYLNDNLFGTNSKRAKLIIDSTKKQLLKILLKQIDYSTYELELLKKSNSKLEEELSLFNKGKVQDENRLKLISQDILYYRDNCTQYISVLNNFLNTEFLQLQDILKQRVISDVKYTYEKEKRIAAKSRLKVIIQTTIKDGIVDIIRDYKYKFVSKLENISEQFELKYKKKTFDSYNKEYCFNNSELFKNSFKEVSLLSNTNIFTNDIIDEIYRSKENKIKELNDIIIIVIKNEFISISKNINEQIYIISNEIISLFFNNISYPITSIKQKIKNNEESLKNQILNIKNNELNKSQLTIEISNKISSLDTISKDLHI